MATPNRLSHNNLCNLDDAKKNWVPHFKKLPLLDHQTNEQTQFLADRSNETAQHAALLRTTNALILPLIIVNSNIFQPFNHERGDFAFSLSIQPIFPTIFGYPQKDFNNPPLLDHIQLET